MAITRSIGFDGTVYEDDWAVLSKFSGAEYAVGGDTDLQVYAVAGQDGTVGVRSGWAYAHGVADYNDGTVFLQLPTVASGTRWDTIYIHRDWTPSNPSGGGTTTIEFKVGSANKGIVPDLDSSPGVRDDQLLAIVQRVAGQQQPSQIIDLRDIRENFTRADGEPGETYAYRKPTSTQRLVRTRNGMLLQLVGTTFTDALHKFTSHIYVGGRITAQQGIRAATANNRVAAVQVSANPANDSGDIQFTNWAGDTGWAAISARADGIIRVVAAAFRATTIVAEATLWGTVIRTNSGNTVINEAGAISTNGTISTNGAITSNTVDANDIHSNGDVHANVPGQPGAHIGADATLWVDNRVTHPAWRTNSVQVYCVGASLFARYPNGDVQKIGGPY